MQSEKFAIRAAFSKAVQTYDDVAGIQRRIADHLLTTCSFNTHDVVLDAGCGTGYGVRRLLASRQDIDCIALDISIAMAACTTGNAICGDIEELPLASACIDLYWSSLAWQWVDMERAIDEAARILRPAGKLCVATLGPRTLCELRTAFADTDNAAHVRHFASADDWLDRLERAGFTNCGVRNETMTTFAIDLRSLLQELKALGAHVVGESRRRGLLGRNAWSRVEANYEALRTKRGLPVTYDVVYLCATRNT